MGNSEKQVGPGPFPYHHCHSDQKRNQNRQNTQNRMTPCGSEKAQPFHPPTSDRDKEPCQVLWDQRVTNSPNPTHWVVSSRCFHRHLSTVHPMRTEGAKENGSGLDSSVRGLNSAVCALQSSSQAPSLKTAFLFPQMGYDYLPVPYSPRDYMQKMCGSLPVFIHAG